MASEKIWITVGFKSAGSKTHIYRQMCYSQSYCHKPYQVYRILPFEDVINHTFWWSPSYWDFFCAMEPPAAPKQSTGQQLGFGRANVRFPPKKRMRLGNDLQMVGLRHIHVCLQSRVSFSLPSGVVKKQFSQNSPFRLCQLPQQCGILNNQWSNGSTCAKKHSQIHGLIHVDTWLGQDLPSGNLT